MRGRLLFLLLVVAFITKASEQAIVVGGDYDYPPYSFVNEKGEACGFDVDVFNALAKIVNIQPIYKFEHWDTTLNHLSKGKIDVIAGIVYSESREKVFDFTFPLHTEYYGIFALKKTLIEDVHNLKGKRAAYLKGDISNDIFLRPMRLLSDSLSVKSLPDALEAVNSGECDYVIAPFPLGMEVISKHIYKNIEVKGPPIMPSVYCFAVNQGNAELLAQLNKGIDELSRNGTLAQIHSKWVKYTRKEDVYENLFTYSLYVLAGLVVVLLILGLFWYSLKIQVERKTRQIKDAEEIYANIFNSVDDALIIVNSDAIILDANYKALKLYDIKYEHIVGIPYLNIVSNENVKIIKAFLAETEKINFEFDGEVSKEIGGETLFFQAKSIKIMLDEEIRFLVVLHDITQKKISFNKLEEAKQMADEANKSKSTFLATISHEIRTPLNAILGYSRLLSKSVMDNKQTDYLNKIEISGEMLLNLVNDVLDITKIEAKKLQLAQESFSLNSVINKVCEVQRFKTKENGLHFVVDIANDLPKLVIGDELRVAQILLNILNNAVKFTHKGSVSLKVNVEQLTNVDNDMIQVLFSIKDTGIGMSVDLQERLFRPFEQAQNTNKRKYGGTGLGLSISKQLIDLMQGTINIESTVDKGTIINVSIPFKIDTNFITVFESESFNIDDHADLSHISVLLVEDNLFNAEVILEQMLDYKLRVKHVESGAMAIAALKEAAFDVVLMDIEMPEMDGFETVKTILENKLSEAPIIALSAHSLDSEKDKAIANGMVAYLSKPVVMGKLIKTIVQYVSPSEKSKPGTIDDAVLAYFGGNVALYQRALFRFKKNFNNVPKELPELFRRNTASLISRVHNIKSASRMLGANELSDIAEMLENKLRSFPNQVDLDQVNKVSESLVNFLATLTFDV